MTSPKIMDNGSRDAANVRNTNSVCNTQTNRKKQPSPHSLNRLNRTNSVNIPSNNTRQCGSRRKCSLDLNGNARSVSDTDNHCSSQGSAFGSLESHSSSSPTQLTAYAGAKFLDPPSPALLPPPPSHWVTTEHRRPKNTFSDMTDHLKMILNVSS